jgi:hypothetical protein
VKHSDFIIGKTFWLGGIVWRCMDIGKRTIIAIRTGTVQIVTRGPDGHPRNRTLSQKEAEGKGWLNGPPYEVAEIVLDECDIKACSLEPEHDNAVDRN